MSNVKSMVILRNLPMVIFSVSLLILLLINQEAPKKDIDLALAAKCKTALTKHLQNMLIFHLQSTITVKY